MASLRWVLLGVGALILVGVFAHSRGWFAFKLPRLKLRRAKPLEPELSDDAPGDQLAEQTAEPAEPEVEAPSLSGNSMVVTVRIMPPIDDRFPAEEMILALREADLMHGKYGIFHRMSEDDLPRIRFSVASLVEPGAFDLTKLKDSYYDGISVFMVLPAPEDGVKLFDDMLQTAREVVRKVDGRLVDEQGSALSVQRERYMREEVIEFLRRRQSSPDPD